MSGNVAQNDWTYSYYNYHHHYHYYYDCSIENHVVVWIDCEFDWDFHIVLVHRQGISPTNTPSNNIWMNYGDFLRYTGPNSSNFECESGAILDLQVVRIKLHLH